MAKTDRRNASVADISFGATSVTPGAPTVAELDALTDIECAVIDGVSASRSGSQIDIHALCDSESSQIAGRITNDPIGMTLFREFDGTDTYWALFDDQTAPAATQYLAVCRSGWTGGTPTASDVCDVYTVNVSARSPLLDDEESQRFEVELTVIDVAFDSVVQA